MAPTDSRGRRHSSTRFGLSPQAATATSVAGFSTASEASSPRRWTAWTRGSPPTAWLPSTATPAAWQPISQGSAGQRNAAILAFLLSYGEEPLVIDQPENDLDNALITDLVVQQLREIRKRRQLIIVTHNPNIVVNADADLVISLSFSGGQIAISEIGGLQEQRVRDEICRIVEGGREAFESRYARIGERHV